MSDREDGVAIYLQKNHCLGVCHTMLESLLEIWFHFQSSFPLMCTLGRHWTGAQLFRF